MVDPSSTRLGQSSKRRGIWDQTSGKLREDVQEAVDRGDGLLEALGVKYGDDFDQIPELSVELMCDLFNFSSPSEMFSQAGYSRMDCMLSQLKGRLNLDKLDQEQRSLLHLAIIFERPECVQLLLVHGADPDLKCSERIGTPWKYLMENQVFINNFREIRAIFEFHHLALLSPRDCIASTWTRFRNDRSYLGVENDTVKANLSETGTFGPFKGEIAYSVAWVHFSKNSVPPIVSISRAIERSVGRRIGCKQNPLTDGVVDCFLDSFTPPTVTPQVPWLDYRNPTYTSRLILGEKVISRTIVFPCLALQTTEEWVQRKIEHTQRWHSLFPEGLSVAPDRLAFYFERTLDEAYYPGLDNDVLEDRNKDQVIQRQTERENDSVPKGSTVLPILMVPQLWLWRIDNTLVSAYGMVPPSNVFFHCPQDDGPVQYLPQLWSQTSVDLQIAHILKDFIDSFGLAYRDPTTKISFPSTLDIFEKAVVTLLSDVRTYITGRESHDIEIEKERKFIESISDIQNELDMIGTIIEQQKGVLDDFKYDASTEADREQKRRKTEVEKLELNQRKLDKQEGVYLESRDVREKILDLEGEEIVEKMIAQTLTQGKHRLDKYTKRIEKINRDVGRVAKTIDDMLNLSRTDASIRLAESSIKEAHYSVLIGLTAGAFAIVTIVFTPLSFVTSLLALPIDQPDTDGRVFKSKTIAWKLTVAEVVTLVVTGMIVFVTYKGFASHFQLKSKERLDSKKKKQGEGENERNAEQGQQAKQPDQLPNDGSQQNEKRAATEEGGHKPVSRSQDEADSQLRGDENV